MTKALLIVMFWILAAILVLATHAWIEPWSPAAGAALTIAVLVTAAYAYMRVGARGAGGTHALAVGIVWLVLSMATELIAARYLGHSWYSLLGSPEHPLLRNVFHFVWIFAPVIFAVREQEL